MDRVLLTMDAFEYATYISSSFPRFKSPLYTTGDESTAPSPITRRNKSAAALARLTTPSSATTIALGAVAFPSAALEVGDDLVAGSAAAALSTRVTKIADATSANASAASACPKPESVAHRLTRSSSETVSWRSISADETTSAK